MESARRPRSLAIISIIILVIFGGSYAVAIVMLLSGSNSLGLQRTFVEPPESEGGIPWPGWDAIGMMLRGELAPLDGIEAQYWWSKMKSAGSLLLGPLLLLGWTGVYIGREWGRACLYVYTATWLADKVIYLFLMRAAGAPRFSLAVGIAVLLILVLRCTTWSAWITQKRRGIGRRMVSSSE